MFSHPAVKQYKVARIKCVCRGGMCVLILRPLLFSSRGSRTLALRVVSVTILQVCFLRLKESTCETRNNYFYFTSKALFKFYNFRYSRFMASSNA